MLKKRKTRVAVVLDPRFSGGTSSAVARELRAVAHLFDLSIHAIETKMFKGRGVNPKIQSALDDLGLTMSWNDRVIAAEVVVLHNPSAFKFDDDPAFRITSDRLIIVTHENFLRPDGVSEGFDVARCLSLIERASISRAQYLAPVSGYNRRGVVSWLSRNPRPWRLTEFDWFNICDFDMIEPVSEPRDRRGRLSRAGYEKFPALSVMKAHFPEHAECCKILGADSFLADPVAIPKHWELHRFGSRQVDAFLSEIDFFVYFTHPGWRESFGRVIAEAICAGKVVITDPGTAEIFGDAVISSCGDDVDAVISGFIADPASYGRFVRRAQAIIKGFDARHFVASVVGGVENMKGVSHDLL